jgi:protein-tyrosine phosphatase
VPDRSKPEVPDRSERDVTEPVLRICVVCSGNICRSPTAEVVLAQLLADAELGDEVVVGSAGTGDWHVGNDMDPRSRETLERNGYWHPVHRARQFSVADFDTYDMVLAIDEGHLARLAQLARLADDPVSAAASISLLRSYDPTAAAVGDLDVPDPYYRTAADFDEVLAQVERACAGLVAQLKQRLAA